MRALICVVVLGFCVGSGCSSGDGWTSEPVDQFSVVDDTTLLLSGHCNSKGRAKVVEEDNDQVIVSMEISGERERDCLRCEEVSLSSPIADRLVVDESDGRSVSLAVEPC